MQRRSGDGRIQSPEFYSIQTQWLRMVNEYCKRNLTYESDILPAISGCASTFQSFTKDVYLAGTWVSDLPRGLLWSVQDSKPSQSYRAPSWSWASRIWMSEGNWSLIPSTPYSHVLATIKCEQDHLPDVRLCSQNLKTKTTDLFGELCENSSITITGHCVNVHKWKIINEGPSFVLEPHFQQKKEEPERFELPLGSRNEWEDGVYICLFITCLTKHSDATELDKGKPYWGCILRRHRHHSHDGFVRVAMTSFSSKIAKFKQGWEPKTVTIY
jgi:hypothetical protein